MTNRERSVVVSCAHFKWRVRRRSNGVLLADGRANSPPLGRHSLDTTDRDEALRVIHDLDRQLAIKAGLVAAVAAEPAPKVLVGLEDGWQMYLRFCSRDTVEGGAGPSTIKRYRPIWQKFSRFAKSVGCTWCNSINRDVISAYLNCLSSEPNMFRPVQYSFGTRRMEATVIKQMMKFLVGEGHLGTECLVKGMRLRKRQGTTTFCYEADQVLAMIDLCMADLSLHWLGHVIVVLAYTGLRIGEVAQLRRSDVNVSKNMLCLPDHTRGGPRIEGLEPRSTKGHRGRELPIHEQLLKTIHALPHHVDGRLLHGPRGAALEPDTVRTSLIKRLIGPLSSRFPTSAGTVGFENGRLHSFRHFFVSNAAHCGIPQETVRLWLGHQDSRMIAHYYHLHDKRAQEEMRKFRIEPPLTDEKVSA